MADGGVETDAINRDCARPRTRAGIIAIIVGVVLVGCAAALILLPATVTVTFPDDAIAITRDAADIDCGAPVTSSSPDFVWNGTGGADVPCDDALRTRRIASGLLALVGAGLLTGGLVVRRRGRTAVSAA